MYCSKCGNEIAEGNIFCQKCATKVDETSVSKTPVEKTATVEAATQNTQKKFGIKKPFLIAGTGILTVGLIIGACIVWNQTFDTRYQKKIASYISNENYEKAESYYQKALTKHSENESVYLYGADIYLVQGKPTEAIAALLKGIAETDSELLKEKKTRIYTEQITAYIREGNYNDAEFFYTKIASLNPKDENVYLYGADIYLAQDMCTDAIEVLDNGITETNSQKLTDRKTYVSEHVLLSEDISYDSDGNLNRWTEYEYDTVGNMTKMIIYDSNSSLIHWYEYEYNATNSMTKRIDYSSDGCIYGGMEYQYDAEDNMTQLIYYNSDDNIFVQSVFEYDITGNKTKMTNYDSDGHSMGVYEYKYDDIGNMTKVIICNPNGNISYWVEYEYNTASNITKEILYNSDSNINYWLEYEYDAANNMTKKTKYDPNGNPSVTYTSTYTYTGTLLCNE